MRTIVKFTLATIALLTSSIVTSCKPTETNPAPQAAAATASPETQALLRNLHRIGWDRQKIMFGQEFPLTFRATSSKVDFDLEQSDCRDVTGDDPGVHGSDFHYMLGKPEERRIHIEAAHRAYQAGALVTFDFHWDGKYGDKFYYSERDGDLLYNVVHNDDSEGDVTWFYQSLDSILEIINDDLGFPIVFRPLHEMNGDWFWWGSQLKGGPEVYKEAYRIIFNYMTERSNLLLFAWSPDKKLATEYYPGDEYVDVIGVDGYGAGNPEVHWFTVDDLVALVEETVDFAAAHGKVAALTETGYDTKTVNYHSTQPNWWLESVLEPILASEKASQIAWILTWINASWSGPYIPDENAPAASIEAFRAFKAHPATLFEQEVKAERIYE